MQGTGYETPDGWAAGPDKLDWEVS